MKEIRDRLFEIMNDKDEFTDRLRFVLVKAGYKHDRGDVLYLPLDCGLEIQYKLDITDLQDGANVIVFNKHIERLELSEEDIYTLAYNNTVENQKPKLESVCEIIGIDLGDELSLYCLTNSKMTFGAGVILYPGMKKKVESIIGDFIVIPSSVHEVLVVPDVGNRNDIIKIIGEVNRTVVSDEEILSDVPYKLVSDGELVVA